jgi:hypothetical protein
MISTKTLKLDNLAAQHLFVRRDIGDLLMNCGVQPGTAGGRIWR